MKNFACRLFLFVIMSILLGATAPLLGKESPPEGEEKFIQLWDSRVRSFDVGPVQPGQWVNLEGFLEYYTIGFNRRWEPLGGKTVSIRVNGMHVGSASSSNQSGKNIRFSYRVPVNHSGGDLNWNISFAGDSNNRASNSSNSRIRISAPSATQPLSISVSPMVSVGLEPGESFEWTVTVRSGSSGVIGARVTINDQLANRTSTVTTSIGGIARYTTVVPSNRTPGNYQITFGPATANGYSNSQPITMSGAVLSAGPTFVNLSGTVRDSRTNNPINSPTVSLYARSQWQFTYQLIDWQVPSNGSFNFPNLISGVSYRISANKSGYDPGEFLTFLNLIGSLSNISLNLTPSAPPNPPLRDLPVNVDGGFQSINAVLEDGQTEAWYRMRVNRPGSLSVLVSPTSGLNVSIFRNQPPNTGSAFGGTRSVSGADICQNEYFYARVEKNPSGRRSYSIRANLSPSGSGLDLRPVSLTSERSRYAPGATVPVNHGVRNQGAANPGAFSVALYASRNSNTTIGGSDILLGTDLYSTGIAVNSQSSGAFNFPIGLLDPDVTYWLKMHVNAGNEWPNELDCNNIIVGDTVRLDSSLTPIQPPIMVGNMRVTGTYDINGDMRLLTSTGKLNDWILLPPFTTVDMAAENIQFGGSGIIDFVLDPYRLAGFPNEWQILALPSITVDANSGQVLELANFNDKVLAIPPSMALQYKGILIEGYDPAGSGIQGTFALALPLSQRAMNEASTVLGRTLDGDSDLFKNKSKYKHWTYIDPVQGAIRRDSFQAAFTVSGIPAFGNVFTLKSIGGSIDTRDREITLKGQAALKHFGGIELGFDLATVDYYKPERVDLEAFFELPVIPVPGVPGAYILGFDRVQVRADSIFSRPRELELGGGLGVILGYANIPNVGTAKILRGDGNGWLRPYLGDFGFDGTLYLFVVSGLGNDFPGYEFFSAEGEYNRERQVFRGSADFNLFEQYIGSASINHDIAGNYIMARTEGSIRIPPDWPIVGGFTYGNAAARVSNDDIRGKASVVFLPTVGFIYRNDGTYEFGTELAKTLDVKKSAADKSPLPPAVIPSGQPSAVIRVHHASGNADLTLTDPNGIVYLPASVPIDPSNPGPVYFHQRVGVSETLAGNGSTVNESVFYLVPEAGSSEVLPGNYIVDVMNAATIGDHTLEVYLQNQPPTIALLTPSAPVTSGGSVTISWTDDDPDDDAEILLFYDTEPSGHQGQLITVSMDKSGGDPVAMGGAPILQSDPSNGTFVWNTTDIPTGRYFIYAMISDGKNAPVLSDYAPGHVDVIHSASPLAPGNLTATPSGNTLRVSWDDSITTPTQYVVLYDDAATTSTTYANQIVLQDGTDTTIPDLTFGRTYRVAVQAMDPENLLRSPLAGPVTVDLRNTSGNNAPSIVSAPRTRGRAGLEYRYQVIANDPDGDTLSFSLEEAPLGMRIDSVSGLVELDPVEEHVGVHHVRVVAADPSGESDIQHFLLSIDNWLTTNADPVFQTTPPTEAVIEESYTYAFAAADADDPALYYTLTEYPAGMVIDASARTISWMPQVEDHGPHTVRLHVSDGRGGEAVQEWTLTVRYPTLDATIALGGAAAGPSPHAVQFTARPTSRFVDHFHWDFGDGATTDGSDERVVRHTWNDYTIADFPGVKNYIVTLTLTGPGDGGPQIATITQPITLHAPRPVADFTADPWSQTKPEGTTKGTLFPFEFTEASRWATNFAWSFTGGGTATGPVANTSFPADSDFTDAFEVTLTATGPSGVATITKQVTLQPAEGTLYTVLNHPDTSNAWPGWRKATTGDIDLTLADDFSIGTSNGTLLVSAESEGHAMAVSPAYPLNEGAWEFEFEGDRGEGGTPSGPDELTILLPGNVPLELLKIPAGSFVMGSPLDERGRGSNEGPQTHVTISRDFYMGKYEVSQSQWLALMGSWPETAPSSSYGVGPNHPAYYISWNDAQNFITTLNAHIISTDQGPAIMRLPTEAEWEYAARAGTTTRFYFGDSLSVGDSCENDGIRSQYMWYCGNSQTQPVGQKLPNFFGLYDMHGNVWEWCQDWYTSSLPGGSVTDPTGPTTGSDRVLRGGGWNNFARSCRSALRYDYTPSLRHYAGGFRLAASYGETAPPISTPPGNYAIYFDGVDDRAKLDHRAIDGLGDFTVEFWTYLMEGNALAGGGQAHTWLSAVATSSTNAFYWVWGSPQPLMDIELFGVNTINILQYHFPYLSWEHLALTRVGNEVRLYRNGRLVDTNSTADDSPLAALANGLWLGAEQDSLGGGWAAGEFLKGFLTELRIWEVARTEQQIRDNMGAVVPASSPGLRAYWRFEEGTGTKSYDLVNGWEADLAATGDAAAWDVDPTPQWSYLGHREPPTAYSLYFDGTDDRVKIDHQAVNGLEDFTIEWWAAFEPTADSGGGEYYFVSGATNGSDNNLLVGSAGSLLYVYLNGAQHSTRRSSQQLDNRKWNHFALKRQGSLVEMILNGKELVEFGSFPSGPVHVLENGFWFGADQDSVGGGWNPAQHLKGRMADLRIWEHARSIEDIAADMNRIVPSDSPGLRANWRFEEGQGLTSLDAVNGWVTQLDASGASTTDINTAPVWMPNRRPPCAGNVPTNGLIAHFPLHSNTLDASGNGRHATGSNVTLTEDRFGNPNGAHYFNNVDGQIVWDQDYDFTFPMSMGGWALVDSLPPSFSDYWLMTDEWKSCPYLGFTLGFRFSGQLVAAFGNNNGCNMRLWVTEEPVVHVGQWTHYMAVFRTASDASLYVDGRLVASTWSENDTGDTTTVVNSSLRPSISGVVDASLADQWFHGASSDIVYYNRALSASEVAQLHGGDCASLNVVGRFLWSADDYYELGLTEDSVVAIRSQNGVRIPRGSATLTTGEADPARVGLRFDGNNQLSLVEDGVVRATWTDTPPVGAAVMLGLGGESASSDFTATFHAARLTIPNLAPVVDPMPSITLYAGQVDRSILLGDYVSDDLDPIGDLTIEFFASSDLAVSIDPTSLTLVVAAAEDAEGDYTVQVAVTDGGGLSASGQLQVIVLPVPETWFTDVTAAAGLAMPTYAAEGIVALAVDRFLLHGESTNTRVVELLSGLAFVDRTTSSGLTGFPGVHSAAAGDLDNDGHEDLVLLADGELHILMGDDAGVYTPWVDSPLLVDGNAITLADGDRDGALDILIAHDGANVALRNELKDIGSLTFVDVTSAWNLDATGETLAIHAADFMGLGHTGFLLLQADGNNIIQLPNDNPTTPTVALALPSASRAASVVDISGNGLPDVVIAAEDGIHLFLNVGKGGFEDVTAFLPAPVLNVTAITPMDVNNDGSRKLYISVNGGLNVLWRFADETVEVVTAEAGVASAPLAMSGRALALDLDGDGDLDLVQVHADRAPTVWRNNLISPLDDPFDPIGRNWMAVEVEATTSNASGIGAVVALLRNGEVRQSHTIGANGHEAKAAHFGLGDENFAEQLRVTFPSGIAVTRDFPEANRVHRIRDERELIGVGFQPEAAFVDVGTSITLMPVAYYADGTSTTLSAGEVGWQVSHTNRAWADGSGDVLALAAGETQVTPIYQDAEGFPTLLVIRSVTVDAIEVTPAPSIRLLPGERANLAANATRSDTTQLGVSSVAQWLNSNSNAALLGNGGVVTALEPGIAEVRAVYQGIASNAVTIEVLTPDAGTLRVVPTSGVTLDLWAGPQTATLAAERVYTDGTSEDVTTTVTWIFGNPFLATFNPSTATVEAQATGETQVRVQSGTVESPAVPLEVLDTGPPTTVTDWMLLE